MIYFPIRSQYVTTKTRLLLWELAIFRIHFLFQIQGGRLGTSLFKGFYRAFNRNDQLSNKESICDHEKATPYLELSDFSHPFLISILIISRNVQFSDKESTISTFNFRRPAARESGNWQFSRKLAKLAIFPSPCGSGSSTSRNLDQY